MGNTRFSGPVSSGDIPNSYTVGTTNYTANVGLAVLTQSATLPAGATSTSVTFWLPQQSQVLNFNFDVTTAFQNATTALQAGTVSNNTAYLGSTAIGTSAVRVAPAFTGTSLFALSNIGTNAGVVLTLTTGTTNTTGSLLATIVYAQTTATFS